MILKLQKDATIIKKLFQRGEVFAYPTEAVFGFGGKPSEATYQKIVALKGRDTRKGVILVAASWAQAQPFIRQLSSTSWQRIQHWEKDGRATTFILPAATNVPLCLCDAEKGNIALRVSKHVVVQSLCELCDSPLISTSANISGLPPATDSKTILKNFPDIPIIMGELGRESRPSRIIDLADNRILRP